MIMHTLALIVIHHYQTWTGPSRLIHSSGTIVCQTNITLIQIYQDLESKPVREDNLALTSRASMRTQMNPRSRVHPPLTADNLHAAGRAAALRFNR